MVTVVHTYDSNILEKAKLLNKMIKLAAGIKALLFLFFQKKIIG